MLTTSHHNTKATLQVSVVLPAYNEATYLPTAVEKTTEILNSFTTAYEIIIAEDGSTDGTAECAQKLIQKYPCVRHIHRTQRLGRGMALNNAFTQSQGEVLAYMDLDLSTDLKYLKPLIEAISIEGYDFATGSRMMQQSKTNRTLSRDLSSQSYNFLVRHMLGSKLKDHQCGFKAFKRESLLNLLGKVEARHWFWDTEVMVRGSRQGLKIKEFAVEWHSGKDTKVNLAKDSWNMFWQIMELWWKLRIKKRISVYLL